MRFPTKDADLADFCSLDFMEGVRVRRVARDRQLLIQTRRVIANSVLCTWVKTQLPLTDIVPEAVDFCMWPSVRAVLELPSSTVVNANSFAETISNMGEHVALWREEVERRFMNAVYSLEQGESPVRCVEIRHG